MRVRFEKYEVVFFGFLTNRYCAAFCFFGHSCCIGDGRIDLTQRVAHLSCRPVNSIHTAKVSYVKVVSGATVKGNSYSARCLYECSNSFIFKPVYHDKVHGLQAPSESWPQLLLSCIFLVSMSFVQLPGRHLHQPDSCSCVFTAFADASGLLQPCPSRPCFPLGIYPIAGEI
jgi:hypothetical protein